jgi:putative nucleotidyltransferase with HDIG domain
MARHQNGAPPASLPVPDAERKGSLLAKSRTPAGWHIQAQLLLFALFLTVGMGIILSSELLFAPHVSVQEGQAASEDIVAPSRIEFASEILTEEARRRALANVREVYDPLDRQVGRDQVRLAQQILDFVGAVRADSYASPALQAKYLASIEGVSLSTQVISNTLQLSDAEWRIVQQETRRVLAEVMRDEIKTDQEDTYRLTVSRRIDLELGASQAEIVNEIASALVKANRVANPEATESARQAALEGVPPQMRVLEQNESILRSGEIVRAEDIEALQELGLLNPQIDWLTVSGVCLFALVLSVSAAIYMWHNEQALIRQPLHLLLLLLLLTSFTLLAKWGLGQSVPLPYLMPLAALGMLVTVLLNARLGLVAQVLLCLAVGQIMGGRLELVLYNLAGGLIGVYSLRRVSRINTFVWAGVYVMFANVIMVITFSLLGGSLDTLRLGQSVLAGVINGVLAAILTLGGYSLLGMAFNITTKLQLLDLARPTHPLMRQLLLKAPGTYHHSIMVGNMAEQAAEMVNADALLARVGAFYHDIGKTVRPYFFSENQVDSPNPHDLLDPETSAQIIRSHTSDGLSLARKYRLPRTISAFITEHHGTSKISYFYHKACQEYGQENVDCEAYQHIGPRPQTKETAIVMLADACEATVRSVRPHDPKESEELVRSIVSKTVASGQLDVAPMTLQEIDIVASSFVNTLQGVFHPRITYPSGEPAQGRRAGSAVERGSLPDAPAGEVQEAKVREGDPPLSPLGNPQERGQDNGGRFDSPQV